MEHYAAITKEWDPAICDNIDGSKGYHAKWNKTKSDKYQVVSIICRI